MAQPTVKAISCTSSRSTTCAKSPWTSKVNSFLSMCDFGTTLDGALPYANVCVIMYGPPKNYNKYGRQANKEQESSIKQHGASTPETPPHTHWSLRLDRSLRRIYTGYSGAPSLSTRACPLMPGSETSRRVPGVSGDTRDYGVYQTDTSAYITPRSYQHPFPLYVAYI